MEPIRSGDLVQKLLQGSLLPNEELACTEAAREAGRAGPRAIVEVWQRGEEPQSQQAQRLLIALGELGILPQAEAAADGSMDPERVLQGARLATLAEIELRQELARAVDAMMQDDTPSDDLAENNQLGSFRTCDLAYELALQLVRFDVPLPTAEDWGALSELDRERAIASLRWSETWQRALGKPL